MAEPVVAQKAPYAKELEAGKTYYWCACGRSANQPFCDGKHKDTGLAPLAFTAGKSGTAYLCGCKASKNAPLRRAHRACERVRSRSKRGRR